MAIVFSSSNVFALKDRLCGIISIHSCGHSRKLSERSSMSTSPTLSGGASINPSGAMTEKGTGLEVLKYGPSYGFGIVTGTGRAGGMFTLGTSEDSFWGTKGFEPEIRTEERRKNAEKYDNDKYALAFGFNLFGRSKTGKKKNFVMDVGLSGKYDPDIKEVKGGVGVSFLIRKFLSLGASYSEDATYFEINNLVDRAEAAGSVAQGTVARSGSYYFSNMAFTAGLKYKGFSFDHAWIEQEVSDAPAKESYVTQYKVYTRIYSTSFFLSKWILTYGRRFEKSVVPKYNFIKLRNEDTYKKGESFLGVQYGISKWTLVGLLHNYYLNRATTLSLTLFF